MSNSYPYGTYVDVMVGLDMEGNPQWIPARAINHATGRFGGPWIKVTTGVDGEEDHKFFVPLDSVRQRVFATRDSSSGSGDEE